MLKVLCQELPAIPTDYVFSAKCVLKEYVQEVLFEVSESNEQFSLRFGT